MKKYILFFLALAFLLPSCDENMPEIACLSCDDEEDPPLGPQDKRVLVEEFTGVKCINCPAGSTEIANLLSQQNGRMIAVSIHAEFFANPYPESNYDFRTDEGEALINFLGLPEAYPSSVIDRKIFPGEADLQLVGLGSWAGRVGTQTQEPARISMEMENTYNSDTRLLTVIVNGQAQEIIDEEVRLTIMIAESGIVDAQLTPESSPDRDLDYVHNHVLRKTLTAFDGDVLTASMFTADTFEKTYTFTLPQEWNASECEVIAFTHLSESSKEVLQAVEEHLTN